VTPADKVVKKAGRCYVYLSDFMAFLSIGVRESFHQNFLSSAKKLLALPWRKAAS
jgi:hypothetical protein